MSVAEQTELDIPLPAPGAVVASARRTVDAALAAGNLDAEADALLIAHLYSLAAAMDRLSGRIEPRALTLLSRELRACAGALGLTREKAPPAGAANPFDFLTTT